VADHRTSKRQDLRDLALLTVNGLLIVVVLVNMRAAGVDITWMAAVAATLIALTLILLWRRHQGERHQRG